MRKRADASVVQLALKDHFAAVKTHAQLLINRVDPELKAHLLVAGLEQGLAVHHARVNESGADSLCSRWDVFLQVDTAKSGTVEVCLLAQHRCGGCVKESLEISARILIVGLIGHSKHDLIPDVGVPTSAE